MKLLYFSAIVIWGLLSSISFGYSGGSGTAEDPYQIATKTDLLALAANTGDYGKCFILTADVDMGGQVFTTAIIAADTNSSSSFQGTAFNGIFDGNNHKITNFTINGGNNSYLGLFGYIATGSVKNLGLENCSVSGSDYVGGLGGDVWGSISNCYSTGQVNGSFYYVGGLVGYNNGNISNCYSTDTVTGTYDSWGTGGLVGYNNGGISNCYSTGQVVLSQGGIGGLVGWNENGGSISNCYSTSQVSSDTNRIGGLVGWNENGGSISNCYSTSQVSSDTNRIGGLVGWNSGGGISNCYSTGQVNGWVATGGLVGESYGSYVSGSFWDINTSSQPTSAGGTGETTTQMKTLLTFTSAGWDFVSVWGLVENQTYPYLRTNLLADLNNDGVVDFKDFAIFAGQWLEAVNP